MLIGQDGGEYTALISDKDVLLSLTLGCKHVHGIQAYEISLQFLFNANTVKQKHFVKKKLFKSR